MSYVMKWLRIIRLCFLVRLFSITIANDDRDHNNSTTKGTPSTTSILTTTTKTDQQTTMVTTTTKTDQQTTMVTTARNINPVVIAVPVAVGFLILVAITVIVIVWYRKRKVKENTQQSASNNRNSVAMDLQIHALSTSTLQAHYRATDNSPAPTPDMSKQRGKKAIKDPLYRNVHNLQTPASKNIRHSEVTLSSNVEDDSISSQGFYENDVQSREVIPDVKYQSLDRSPNTTGGGKYENIKTSHTESNTLYDDGTYENAEPIHQVTKTVTTRRDNENDTDSDDGYIKPPQYYRPNRKYSSNGSDNDDYERPIQHWMR